MNASEFKRVKDLEAENARLKRMYADLSLVHEALKRTARRPIPLQKSAKP